MEDFYLHTHYKLYEAFCNNFKIGIHEGSTRMAKVANLLSHPSAKSDQKTEFLRNIYFHTNEERASVY